MTHNITLGLPDDLWENMEKYPEVKWSAVAKKAIEEYITKRENPQ